MYKVLLTNRPLQIVIAVILILAVVYFMGRKAGKNAEVNSFWNKLFGSAEGENPEVDLPEDITINGQKPAEKVEGVTDAIYQSFEGRIPFLFANGTAINQAFSLFNVLGNSGKASVINDWNARYYNTDKAYVGTGDYGTLRKEVSIYAPGTMQPQVAIAYKWMQDNNIN